MTLRKLPEGGRFERPQNFQWDAPSDVLARWAEAPLAAADLPDTISIFDVIGEDPWTGGGFTARRAAAALRAIGSKPVTVQMNSPGGDVFEGVAIYNLLREHPAKVTIDVMGWAASAASVIAMAGDEIRMGLGTIMMLHNAWGLVIGNRHDFAAAVTTFEAIDRAITDIYEARSGAPRKEITALMDAETFLGAKDAVAKGFADSVSEDLKAVNPGARNAVAPDLLARRQVEAALAKANYPRSMRSEIIAELVGASATARDAGRRSAARDAGETAAMRQILATLKS